MVRYAGYGGDSVEDLISTVIEGPYVLRSSLSDGVERGDTPVAHSQHPTQRPRDLL
jgi:hypothetical protein